LHARYLLEVSLETGRNRSRQGFSIEHFSEAAKIRPRWKMPAFNNLRVFVS